MFARVPRVSLSSQRLYAPLLRGKRPAAAFPARPRALSSQSSVGANSQKGYGNEVLATALLITSAVAASIYFSQTSGVKEGKETTAPVPFEVSLQKCLSEISGIVGKESCHTNIEDRESHSKDWSYHEPRNPDAVVYVNDEQQISKVLQACNKYGIPVIPWGSGTSLEGHVLPQRGGITLVLSNMNRVVSISPDDLDVTVEPGVTWEELAEVLKPHGLFFPPDPGPGASIGGMCGTSCSGTNAWRYGTMKENVISLRVALADGTIVQTGTRAHKSSAGYDLTHLFVGSEGTLGVVTRATLRLRPIPKTRRVGLATFKSLEDAGHAVAAIVKSGIGLSRLELVDDACVKAVNMNSTKPIFNEAHTLLLEFSGYDDTEISRQSDAAKPLLTKAGASSFRFARNQEESATFWEVRKTALFSAQALAPMKKMIITDVCVPVTKLARCLEETKDDLKKADLIGPIVAHAGDGNFHVFLLVDTHDPEEMKKALKFKHDLVIRAQKMEGTCTGEHGVGEGKRDFIVNEVGASGVQLMRSLKNLLDPKAVLNPGKVIPDA